MIVKTFNEINLDVAQDEIDLAIPLQDEGSIEKPTKIVLKKQVYQR